MGVGQNFMHAHRREKPENKSIATAGQVFVASARSASPRFTEQAVLDTARLILLCGVGYDAADNLRQRQNNRPAIAAAALFDGTELAAYMGENYDPANGKQLAAAQVIAAYKNYTSPNFDAQKAAEAMKAAVQNALRYRIASRKEMGPPKLQIVCGQ